MKTINKILSILIILLIVSSCRQITVTTKVHKDGSFTRLITITGDSSDVFKSDLPYPIDESWDRIATKDTIEEDRYILVYSKTYRNSDLLNKEIAEDTGWRKQLNRNIEVNKRYGLFYSYLTYKETIQAANPFTALDYRDYLSQEDLLWISNGKIPLTEADSNHVEDLEDKAMEFIENSATEEMILALKKGTRELNDPNLTPEDIELYRDSIKEFIIEYSDSLDAFYNQYESWSNNSSIHALRFLDPPFLLDLDKNIESFNNLFEMEGYKQNVEMPGLITETNSVSLTGNQVSWGVDSTSILFEDRVMFVESRIINIWGYIIGGTLLVSLIVILLVKTRKTKDQ